MAVVPAALSQGHPALHSVVPHAPQERPVAQPAGVGAHAYVYVTVVGTQHPPLHVRPVGQPPPSGHAKQAPPVVYVRVHTSPGAQVLSPHSWPASAPPPSARLPSAGPPSAGPPSAGPPASGVAASGVAASAEGEGEVLVVVAVASAEAPASADDDVVPQPDARGTASAERTSAAERSVRTVDLQRGAVGRAGRRRERGAWTALDRSSSRSPSVGPSLAAC